MALGSELNILIEVSHGPVVRSKVKADGTFLWRRLFYYWPPRHSRNVAEGRLVGVLSQNGRFILDDITCKWLPLESSIFSAELLILLLQMCH